jgi:hypothetical protein
MPMNPRLLRPTTSGFNPRQISDLALWLDGADASSLYTTDAGPVTAVSSPTEISGCVGWWDASDISSITQSGGLVSQWNDKSGSGLHVSQATAGLLPGVATVNGLNAVDFDGTDDYMFTTSEPPVFTAMLCVHVCDVVSTAHTLLGFVRGTGATLLQATAIYSSINEYRTPFFSVSTSYPASGGTATAGVPSLLATSFSGSAAALRVRGATETGTTSQSGTNVSGVWFGMRNVSGTPGVYLNGKLCEVLLFSAVPSASDLRRLEKYLADKWGVPAVHAPATATSDPVGLWQDKSGFSRNVTQSTGASRPSVASIGGRTALAFDGSNDCLVSTPRSPTRPANYAVVYRPKSTATGAIISDCSSAATPRLLVASGSSVTMTSFPGGDISINSAAVGAPSILVLGAESSTAFLRRDGIVATGTTGVTPSNNQALTIGSRFVGTAQSLPLNGDIGEILVYQKTLSATEITRIERYLAAKWGVTLYAPPAYADADVNAYISAVELADGGVALETGVRNAMNDFIVGCKADGIWGAIKASCILAGARTLSGALVPLRGSAPTNNGPFVSGDYDRKGLAGNGSTKWLDSNRANNADPQDSNHHAVWAVTADSAGASRSYIDAGGTGAGANNIGRSSAVASLFVRNRCNAASQPAFGSSTGFIATSRSASTGYTLRASATNTSITQASQTPSTDNVSVYSRAGTNATNAKLAWYSIGESVDLALLDARLSTLITAIGAAVP